MTHDPRLTLARSDLAAAGLEGLTRATRFAPPAPRQTRSPRAAIRAGPHPAAEQVDQLLFGEIFEVLEINNGFAWGQARRDGYVGFVHCKSLSMDIISPSHWVSVPRTLAFATASIKAPPFGPLSLNALVTIDADEGRLLHAPGAGWIPRDHLTVIGNVSRDPAAVAEGFVGTPYLWGGRDGAGLDCSGLIQQALHACGRACPRDADQQARLGSSIGRSDLQRNDLVFWLGHVGMMLDSERMIHANAYHMTVAVEPLAAAVARIAGTQSGQPSGFRRLSEFP